MIVDLEEKEVAGTFELKGGGKVHLRLRNEKDEKEIRAVCVSEVTEYPLLKDPVTGKEDYRPFTHEKTDTDRRLEMSWDRNITGWDDLFDKNEKPIPVTKGNKVLLMTRVPEFLQAVMDGIKALMEKEKAKAKAAEKN